MEKDSDLDKDKLKEEEEQRNEKIEFLRSLDGNSLAEFLINNPNFCKENKIKYFEIIFDLGDEEQKAFLGRLKDLNFNSEELKEIFLSLSWDVKQGVDKSQVPDEYKACFDFKTCTIKNDMRRRYLKIIEDLEEDPEKYRGLDKWVEVNPIGFNQKQREALFKICDVCPTAGIEDSMRTSFYGNAL